MLKLLHTADWHLGRRFRAFTEEQETKLTRARLEVIERIFRLAERFSVDAVLCAGDLFDVPCPPPVWREGLADLLRKRPWKGRPVFLLPGNHDPLVPGSVWAAASGFRALLPEWVHVVDRADFRFDLPNGAVLHAVPCVSQSGAQDPTQAIPPREAGDERIRIGMVHGSTFDVKGCQTNFPIAADAARARGLDYLAIGDTHGFRFVPPDCLHPPTIYPGAPEPTAFDEQDPGHVAVVFINRQRRATVKKERVARWTWEEIRVTTLDGLREIARRADLGDRVLRLRLEMRVSAPELDEAERLLEDLGGTPARPGRAGVLNLDREGLELEPGGVEASCGELPEVLKSAVRRLTQAADDPAKRPAALLALMHLYRLSRTKAS